VILGAGGDLTSRHLIPALAELDAAGVLPAGIAITGVDRQPWDDESFRQHLIGAHTRAESAHNASCFRRSA
jgi:glucose-6-phosphate 1-dehydrogenase